MVEHLYNYLRNARVNVIKTESESTGKEAPEYCSRLLNDNLEDFQ